MFRRVFFASLVCVLALSPFGARADKLDPDHPPLGALPSEQKMGDEAAKEFESAKTTKLLDVKASPANQALQDKINAMVERLGKASPRPNIAYRAKIVENKDINAFTLPGGYVYVYRGLIDFCSSDDELAGVLAHELGHNARLHALRGQNKAKKLNWISLAAIAAALAGGQGGAGVMQFTQYALIGALNGYGVGLEKEADASAVETMKRAGYNPSALVTFMRRLKEQDERRPNMELGIFTTHPPSGERADAVLEQMKREGLTFTPREVSGGALFSVQSKDGRPRVEMNGLLLLEFPSKGNGPVRAQNAAARLNELWRADLKAYELSVSDAGVVMARGTEIARVQDGDDVAIGLPKLQIVQSWRANFQRLFWREQVRGKV